MPAHHRLAIFLVVLMAIFLFLPKEIFAQVVINEFSAMTSTDDWVEIYNNSSGSLDLSEYILVDSVGNQKELPVCLLAQDGVFSVDWYNKLNNGGDKILLKKGESTLDCVAYNSGPACEEREIDLPSLNAGEYGVRQPGGSDSWMGITSHTKADNSQCEVVISTPSPSPIPTSISSPETAIYKINEAKDEDGNVLSSVKVHIDGVYAHHYAPETLTFCDGCQCDTYIDCGFGEHTIKLEKSGFANWSETKIINAGNTYEVNPVMSSSGFSSPSSSVSTPSPSLSPNPSPRPVKVIGLSLSGEVLGEEKASETGFFPWEATEGAGGQEATGASENKFIPKLFLGLGLIFLIISGCWVWYTQLKKKQG